MSRPHYHVPATAEDQHLFDRFQRLGIPVLLNPDVPPGMVEVRTCEGELVRRFDWRADFERWQRERG